MGYDFGSLFSEVDDAFLCSICTKVLENSMGSPCEHTFCYVCIKEWLEVKPSCPVDSCFLTLDDMKPTPRYFRNLLDKVEVKCNFGKSHLNSLFFFMSIKCLFFKTNRMPGNCAFGTTTKSPY